MINKIGVSGSGLASPITTLDFELDIGLPDPRRVMLDSSTPTVVPNMLRDYPVHRSITELTWTRDQTRPWVIQNAIPGFIPDIPQQFVPLDRPYDVGITP